MAKLNAKLLDGLTFKTSEAKEVKDENGSKKTKYFPVERPLTVDDVLDWKDLGDKISIVTADGKKYTVPKSGKAADAE